MSTPPEIAVGTHLHAGRGIKHWKLVKKCNFEVR